MVGSLETFKPLVVGGVGYNGYGQQAGFLGGLGYDRSGSGARASAHSGGDEDYVDIAAYVLFDMLNGFESGVTAFLRIHACSESFGESRAELNLVRYGRCHQGLAVGIADEEFHVLYALVVETGDCVAASASYSDNLDVGHILEYAFGYEICNCHDSSTLNVMPRSPLSRIFP